MGKIMTVVRLTNTVDAAKAKEGTIRPEEVRIVEVKALVDTGASLMALPEELVSKLGLEIFTTKTSIDADGNRTKRPIARALTIEIGDRAVNQDCSVLSKGATPLIGQLVLEEMDLVADPSKGVVVPGHPDEELPVMDLR